MKTTLLLKEECRQLVLHAETTHEASMLNVLESLPNTHRTDFYEQVNVLVITFDKEVKEEV